MLQKIFATGALLCTSAMAFSQIAAVTPTIKPDEVTATSTSSAPPPVEKKPLLAISGSVDAYYRYDFDKQPGNIRTSFTGTHNEFALGMASVKFEHTTGKVSAVLDLGFGQRAKDFAYTDDGITQAIKQLYVSYTAKDWLKFTAGTWATHVGYELLDPQANRNYSMSYMFTNGPFSHTGLKADITQGKHGVMVGISNPTDYRKPPSGFMNKKFFIAQYSYAASDNVKLYLNYVGGKNPDTSKGNQFDAVVTATINSKFGFGVNGTYSTVKPWDGVKNTDANNWYGAALYLNADPLPWFGLTLRSEYFSDKDGVKGIGSSLFANTLSANFKVDGFTLIPEFRIENAKDEIYLKSSGAPKKTAGSFILAAVYKF